MANLSVRGLDDAVLAELKRRAGQNSASVNSLVVRLLNEAIIGCQSSRSATQFHDLDDLAGTWSAQDQHDFETATQALAEVDADLWKDKP